MSAKKSIKQQRAHDYDASVKNRLAKNELRNHSISIDDVFKNKHMTFEDIEKLNYQQFNIQDGEGQDQFRPSDILDLDDADDSDDEILQKFRDGPKKRRTSPRKAYPGPYVNQGATSAAGKPPYSDAGNQYGGSPSRLKQYKSS